MKYRWIILLTIILYSCNDNYTPKPKGFFRIELQDKTYIPFNSNNYPFSFEIASVSRIINFENAENKDAENNWFDIYYPFYKARIYCTYTPLTREKFRAVSEDSYRFVYRHSIKADAIGEEVFSYPEKRTSGILYTLSGNTASPVQFIVTDSTRHFFRGALYFDDCIPNQDSLRPVINYIYDDIFHLIDTFNWK